ncbi:hypothetical protein CHS0354_020048 [Potamilus streckersoni]|uniref:Uncharacterized protein n=1 Tax=Potamilus streckersoni TaxID=2493646 RepID=A0AAE0VY08_9BIVA|nr:hypothetical protein CHS0354_020048 [Potamilus streckersoni]
MLPDQKLGYFRTGHIESYLPAPCPSQNVRPLGKYPRKSDFFLTFFAPETAKEEFESRSRHGCIALAETDLPQQTALKSPQPFSRYSAASIFPGTTPGELSGLAGSKPAGSRNCRSRDTVRQAFSPGRPRESFRGLREASLREAETGESQQRRCLGRQAPQASCGKTGRACGEASLREPETDQKLGYFRTGHIESYLPAPCPSQNVRPLGKYPRKSDFFLTFFAPETAKEEFESRSRHGCIALAETDLPQQTALKSPQPFSRYSAASIFPGTTPGELSGLAGSKPAGSRNW